LGQLLVVVGWLTFNENQNWSRIHIRRDWSSHKGAWRPLYMDLGSVSWPKLTIGDASFQDNVRLPILANGGTGLIPSGSFISLGCCMPF